jgi:hypothetical protein
MKVTEQDGQKKIRRKVSEALLVYDLHSGLPMGQILDMSSKGMKMITEKPVAVNRVYYCKIPLEKKINNNDKVCFDAECRWCKKDETTGWYNSGYILRYPTPGDAEIIKELTHRWMVNQANKLNAPRKRIAHFISLLNQSIPLTRNRNKID